MFGRATIGGRAVSKDIEARSDNDHVCDNDVDSGGWPKYLNSTVGQGQDVQVFFGW